VTDVIGAIRDKWLSLGGEAGFGQPLDVERPTFDGRGRNQSFRGDGTISWHPETVPTPSGGSSGKSGAHLGVSSLVTL
jgi:uncharacterized protein with LGFP repeats